MERASKFRDAWLQSLVRDGLLGQGIDREALSDKVAESGRAMTARVCLAMLQEGVLQTVPDEDGKACIEIPRPGGRRDTLTILGLTPSVASLFPQLQLLGQKGPEESLPIEDPVELLDFVRPLLEGASGADLERLVGELTDAQQNDALCGAYRSVWDDELRAAARAAGSTTFWQWLLSGQGPQNPNVLLDQWSATGHPYHPTHKTRRGMSPAEVLAYCPEFRPRVQVRLIAARRESVRGETLHGGASLAGWLDHYFPAAVEAWRGAVTAEGRDPENYIAMPVHPWQAEHAVPERFSRSLAQGDLLLLPELLIPADPLVSVRTLAAATSSDAPHFKLSLGVRLTSVERTISPRSCEMGPRISHLLDTLIQRDEILSDTLRFLPEEVGLYYLSAEPEEAEVACHLAAVLRGSPARLSRGGGIVVPATALPVASPLSAAPLFFELGPGGEIAAFDAARTRFARYAEAFLRPLLTLYLRYGIALEAHLQNSLVHLDADGEVQHYVFRDFGGIRIHEASLSAAGFSLKVHPDRLTVVDDRRPVRGKFTAHGLHRHLGFLVSRISRHLGVGEGPFWSDVADVVQTVMEELRGDIPAETWRKERAALLHDDWEFKANLRMRIADSSKDVYVQIANPLRRRN